MFRLAGDRRSSILRARWIRLLLVLALVALVYTPSVAHAQGAPYCPPGQPATFVLGFAFFKSRLGDLMGDPVECEHYDTSGAEQRTTTGIAFWNKHDNGMYFWPYNGEGWEWTANGLVRDPSNLASGHAIARPRPPEPFTLPVYARNGATLGTATIAPAEGTGVAFHVVLAGFDPGLGGNHWFGVADYNSCWGANFEPTGSIVVGLPAIQFYPDGSADYRATTGAVSWAWFSPGGKALLIRADEGSTSEIIACVPVVLSWEALPTIPPGTPGASQ